MSLEVSQAYLNSSMVVNVETQQGAIDSEKTILPVGGQRVLVQVLLPVVVVFISLFGLLTIGY